MHPSNGLLIAVVVIMLFVAGISFYLIMNQVLFSVKYGQPIDGTMKIHVYAEWRSYEHDGVEITLYCFDEDESEWYWCGDFSNYSFANKENSVRLGEVKVKDGKIIESDLNSFKKVGMTFEIISDKYIYDDSTGDSDITWEFLDVDGDGVDERFAWKELNLSDERFIKTADDWKKNVYYNGFYTDVMNAVVKTKPNPLYMEAEYILFTDNGNHCKVSMTFFDGTKGLYNEIPYIANQTVHVVNPIFKENLCNGTIVNGTEDPTNE